jgi:PAT family beta-lactamase induction signal transducer AmpG
VTSPTPTVAWPALSEHRWLRFTAFFLFYLCQGFPIGLTSLAFPAWLTARGFTETQVAAFVGTVTLPWALKLFAGPFMDRFAFPAMGLRRPWVIGAQSMLVLSGLTLFLLHDPHTQLGWLTVACTLMNTCAAVQDVAVDGMAVTVLRDDERGRANGFMVAGQVAGYSATGWLSVKLLNTYGIPAAGALTAVAVGAVGLVAVVFRERPGERVLPWSAGAAHPDAPVPERNTLHLLKSTAGLLLLPMSLILLSVEASYRVLEGITMVWHPKVAITTFGYTDEMFSQWSSTTSAIAAACGLLMGVAIDRMGARRGVMIGLLTNAAIYAMLCFTSASLAVPVFAVGVLAATQLGSQWMFISTVSLFMKLCGLRVAATQFAIYMALSNLARSGGARVYPWLTDWFGAEGIYVVMVVGYLIGVGILAFFSLEKHRRELTRLGET